MLVSVLELLDFLVELRVIDVVVVSSLQDLVRRVEQRLVQRNAEYAKGSPPDLPDIHFVHYMLQFVSGQVVILLIPACSHFLDLQVELPQHCFIYFLEDFEHHLLSQHLRDSQIKARRVRRHLLRLRIKLLLSASDQPREQLADILSQQALPLLQLVSDNHFLEEVSTRHLVLGEQDLALDLFHLLEQHFLDFGVHGLLEHKVGVAVLALHVAEQPPVVHEVGLVAHVELLHDRLHLPLREALHIFIRPAMAEQLAPSVEHAY